jgi:hypothetical protein
MEMEALALCIGRFIQTPSILTEESDQATEPRRRFMYARSVLALSSVLEVSKWEPQIVLGVLNQALTKQFAFQSHPVLQDKSQHLVYALLVLQGLSIARAERQRKRAAAVAKYPMQVRQLVYGMARQLVQLVHISIHLLLPTILTVLLVPQATHVQVDLLLHHSVLPVKL